MNIMRVLENNNKPATHFIEVWRNPESDDRHEWNNPADIVRDIDSAVDFSNGLNFITIAIFKIRAK